MKLANIATVVRHAFPSRQDQHVYIFCVNCAWIKAGLAIIIIKLGSMADKRIAVICFGCGNDITLQAANRYNLRSPSCKKTFRIWKRLVVEKFDAANIDFDALLNNENGTAGKICRRCSSALQRLEKLVSSTRENLNEAIDAIVSVNPSAIQFIASDSPKHGQSSITKSSACSDNTTRTTLSCGRGSMISCESPVAVS